jgi:hypothetical protein
MALASARQDLALPRNMALHPLLALWASDSDLFAPLTDFNAFDTLSVRRIVKSDPEYVACTPTVAGSCEPGREEVSVVLSELRDIGGSSVAVRLIVTDRRPGQPYQRHYFAQLNGGLSGWSVVEFRDISR